MDSTQELNKKIILDKIKERKSSNITRVAEVEKQISHLNKRKSELLDMRLDGKLDDETYLEKLNEITNDLFGIKKELSKSR